MPPVFGNLMVASVYIAVTIAIVACAIAVGWVVLRRYPPLKKNTEKDLEPDEDDE